MSRSMHGPNISDNMSVRRQCPGLTSQHRSSDCAMSQLKMQNSPELDKPIKLKDKIVMIPVEAQDFRKINEFAEASMIYRNPEKSEEIKEMRRKKLREHNQEMSSAPSLGEK